VKVLTDLVEEEGKECLGGIAVAICLGLSSDLAEVSVELVGWEEFRDPARREQIVDRNKESVLGDLGVGEEEEQCGARDTSLDEHALDINEELVEPVAGGDYNTHHEVVKDEGSELG